jgi:5-methylcytosine-specific restriction endonuclease McrA
MPGDPYYRTPEWRQLRTAALKRDRFTCTVPGCKEKATHVDHITSRRNGGTNTLGNLRSLCTIHDGQVKEKRDGTRANKGKFKLIGCGPDGWPHARAKA